jgi:hypothetical protein
MGNTDNFNEFMSRVHPDIVMQFIHAKTMLEELGCVMVSTTAWSLLMRVDAIPDTVDNACQAGTLLAEHMNASGWSNCDHHHSNFNEDEVFVSVPYNLSSH